MVEFFRVKDTVLALEIRRKIFALIEENPGLHFRDVQRRSGTATGTITHHLDCLTKAGLVKAIPDGGFLRYYCNNKMMVEKDKMLLELVRRKIIRHLLLCLLEDEECNNEKLSVNLQLSPSTISWHIKRLEESKVVSRRETGRKVFYTLNKPEVVLELLIKYRESFMDILLDRFIEMWDS